MALLRVLFPTFHSQFPLHIPPLAIQSAVSTQSLSSFLLIHLVIPTSLTLHSIPILENIPISWSALDPGPQSLAMIKLLITRCSTYLFRKMMMLFLNCCQVVSLLVPIRALWTIWISSSIITHGSVPPSKFTIVKVSLLESLSGLTK